jgi:hypothetical protein
MKRSLFGCLFGVFMVAAQGFAQLVAGSPEDALFRMISAAQSPEQKIELASQFEDEFPEAPSPVLVSVFTTLMNSYESQQNSRQARRYGEKVIAEDPQNVNAYMTLCRLLSVNLVEDLPMAVEYGERAVELAEGLRVQEAPPNYTVEQWQTYTAQTEQYARSILSYARTVQR